MLEHRLLELAQQLISRLDEHSNMEAIMTPDQINLVRSTWEKIVPIADNAADLFYSRLFEIDPKLRNLFETTNLAAQKKKLLQALATAIASLDALDKLAPQPEELGCRHATYGVIDSHYEAVGSALLWTLQHGLGDGWSRDAEAAWSAVYGLVAKAMQAGAASHQDRIRSEVLRGAA